jgi:hypothetical protein
MSRFSKPTKKFTPPVRRVGDESLERQVLSNQSVRSSSSAGASKTTWNWRDSYVNIYVPQDPIILSSSFQVAVYEKVNLFVTENNMEREFFILDENGNPEVFSFWTDNYIGDETFYVLDENGEPEEFSTYDD